MGDETTILHAISIEGHILQTRGLRFDAPEIVRRTDPKGCRYWWGLLEFAIDMEDPTTFPPLKVQPAKADAVLLRRYCETADVLAQSKQLVAANHISIRATRDPETGTFSEEVEAKLAPPDLTAGFGAYFRQLYGDGEPRVSSRRAASCSRPSNARFRRSDLPNASAPRPPAIAFDCRGGQREPGPLA
jgi:hypothetical protein